MNKKILSIFALIMALSFAVSCSNDSNNPNKGNGGGNPVVVSLKTASDATESSTLTSEYAGSASAFPDVTVSVTGTDAANMVNTASGGKNKILVSVKSVSAVTKSGYKNLSGVQTADVTIKSVTTTASSEAVVLSIPGANITGTGSNPANKISTDNNAASEKGMLKVELEFKDESGVKTTTPLTVYITVSNTAA